MVDHLLDGEDDEDDEDDDGLQCFQNDFNRIDISNSPDTKLIGMIGTSTISSVDEIEKKLEE